MRVPITKLSLSTAAAVGAAVLFAACSDQTSAPRSLTAGGPDLQNVSSFPVELGALQQTINSGSGINYCGYNSTVTPTAATTFSLAGSCVAAHDLNSDLLTYNPGWSEGFNSNAAHWIGPTDHLDPNFPSAFSNQYVAAVGTYSFVTTFNITDATAINRALEVQVMADNAAAVYLNGTYIGGNQDGVGNPVFQDCPVEQTNCNWTQAGSVKITAVPTTGTNTLRVDLVGTAIGYQVSGTPRSNCTNGPQFTGFLGFTSTTTPTPQHLDTDGAGPITQNWTSCLNPTGVDFTARVYYDIPTLNGCSPGYWKNHLNAWPTSLQSTKFGTIFTAAAGTTIGNMTLIEVLNLNGGGINALGRIAVSAYLNALGIGSAHYGLTTVQVQNLVNGAITSGSYSAVQNQLESLQDVFPRTCPNPTISLD
jgi:hypothetical protein